MLLKFIIVWVIIFVALLILVPFILYILTFIYHLLFKEEQKKIRGKAFNFRLRDLKIPKTGGKRK